MITQRPGQDLTPEMATPSSEWSAPQCKAVSPRAWLVLAEDAPGLAGLNFEMAVNHLQMAADLCSQSPKQPTCRAALAAQPPGRSRERARAGADQWPQSAAVRPCATPCQEDCRPVRSPASRSRRRRLRDRSRNRRQGAALASLPRLGPVVAAMKPDEKQGATGGSSPPSASHGQPLTP
jgi:hypothetical protein